MRARAAVAAAVFLVALAAAVALKRFHAAATAADLRILLAPTTWLVEAAGGHRFDWTAAGYVSTSLRFVITPACAGVNFLVVAFAGLVLAFVRPARPPWQNVAILLASAAAAVATTLVANALRILVAIPLWTHGVTLGPLGAGAVHELAGVAVFVGTLLALHLAARRLAGAPFRAWIPLLPYAAVTLLVPLLRGAHRRPEFRGHAAIVVGALLVAAAASAALRRAAPGQGPAAPAPGGTSASSRSQPATSATTAAGSSR